jgi:uncharacterized protein YndB with AHSA1/START domain
MERLWRRVVSASVWGTVTEWAPGKRLSFTWHPGREVERASRVSVSFTAHPADQTLVVLEHSGWDGFDDPETARNEYSNGWPPVLGLYSNAVIQHPESEG